MIRKETFDWNRVNINRGSAFIWWYLLHSDSMFFISISLTDVPHSCFPIAFCAWTGARWFARWHCIGCSRRVAQIWRKPQWICGNAMRSWPNWIWSRGAGSWMISNDRNRFSRESFGGRGPRSFAFCTCPVCTMRNWILAMWQPARCLCVITWPASNLPAAELVSSQKFRSMPSVLIDFASASKRTSRL